MTKREERLRAALQDIADNADHVDHAYLVCGKCKAKRALDAEETQRPARKREAS